MRSIWDALNSANAPSGARLHGVATSVSIGDLRHRTSLSCPIGDLAGRSVLIATQSQLSAALALIELDGVARRLVIGTPDLPAQHIQAILAQGQLDVVISDAGPRPTEAAAVRVVCTSELRPVDRPPLDRRPTEWVLLTSGTTGAPKMVVHSLWSLSAAIKAGQAPDPNMVWGTFYDIRRYGGLQIFLRAVLGGVPLVLSDAEEPLSTFLSRLAHFKATHISGTPSHWRRALMSACLGATVPRYVRLSGEVADQTILTRLRAFFPEATIAHAFATTEAGVAFEVADGLAGFPADFLGLRGHVELQVENGSLRLRSPGAASRYLGANVMPITDSAGFVDTGDGVELREGRYYFMGRRSGVINVGGLKVYPEEVEAAINRHPSVHMSRVRSKNSPITGAVVTAEVVLKPLPAYEDPDGATKELKREILAGCRDSLAAYKVPVTIRFVPDLQLGSAGKLGRVDA